MALTMIGRDRELGRIDTFLDASTRGPSLMVIEGPPGMGKTTLLQVAVDHATVRGFHVLRAGPSGVEATYAYAGLGDLLASVPYGSIRSLPVPQQHALQVALMRESPTEQGWHAQAVAVGSLGVLRDLSSRSPVLLIVDDAQWLDAPSAMALDFAIRRLHDERLGLLVTSRLGEDEWQSATLEHSFARLSAERMTLGPLDVQAVQRLLATDRRRPISGVAAKRIHTATAGNPMFALEFARSLDEAGMDPEEADPPLPPVLQMVVGQRMGRLPPRTRDALGIAALLLRPTVELIGRAADGDGQELLDAAVAADVIQFQDGRIWFTHPLRAAVARSMLQPARRQQIHGRLANLVSDPEERARHLALSVDGPEETIAQALETAAHRARERGAPDVASELAGMSWRRTAADQRADIRRRRGLEAANLLIAGGDLRRARALVEQDLPDCPPGVARAQILILLAWIQLSGLDWSAARRLLEDALVEAAGDTRMLARVEGALTTALELSGDVPAALVHGRAELVLGELIGDDAHVATALRGIARNEQRLSGHVPVSLIGRALELEPVVRLRPVTHWPSVAYAEMLSWTDDLETARMRWTEVLELARDRGEESSVIDFLPKIVILECVAGAFDRALAYASEGEVLAAGAAQGAYHATMLASRALVEAHLGDAVACREDARTAGLLASRTGALVASTTAAWATGLLELSLGDPAATHRALDPLIASRRATGIREPGELRFVPDEIEALIALGLLAEAGSMLEWYRHLAEDSGRIGALAACGRCEGLLLAARGDLGGAIESLQGSRARYEQVIEPFGAARTLLALGSTARRARKLRMARQCLDAATTAFRTMGAVQWADLARAEAVRVGGRRPTVAGLTPTEQEVAELVASGHSNGETAAAMFITVRTVEGHLSRIYAKLGLRSRSELAHHYRSVAGPG